jgi:hypothetical protein
VGRKPIPRPGFLETCNCLGQTYGERRWRNSRRTPINTWDGLHGEVEVFNERGEHQGAVDAVTGLPMKPARKGGTIRV